jgi:hypothetical protein
MYRQSKWKFYGGDKVRYKQENQGHNLCLASDLFILIRWRRKKL